MIRLTAPYTRWRSRTPRNVRWMATGLDEWRHPLIGKGVVPGFGVLEQLTIAYAGAYFSLAAMIGTSIR